MESKKLLEAFSKSERAKLLKNFSEEEFAREILRRQAEVAPVIGGTAMSYQTSETPPLQADPE